MGKKKTVSAKQQAASAQLAANERFLKVTENVLTTRTRFLRELSDPRRSVYDECGLPQTERMTTERYREFYDREAVATRVVEVMPAESWLVQPTVMETAEADSDDDTEFEKAWDAVGNSIGGESWFEDKESNPIWEYLQRVDKLSGIGSFGALLLGVDDGKPLEEPLEAAGKITFLRAFDQAFAQIIAWEPDHTNVRFGQPVAYNVTFNSQHLMPDGSNTTVDGNQSFTKRVHWTRIIHVADNIGSSEIYGVPRMQPVYNNLHAIQKVLLGSGEMFWKQAFPGLSIQSLPQLGPNVIFDDEKLRDMTEDYQNGLQRILRLVGFEAKTLPAQVSDPTAHVDAQINAICIKMGIPKRVFTGSELGNLASTEDTKRWNSRLAGRRSEYITPRIIVPFINRLIQAGILPKPKSYSVVWPTQESLTEAEKAEIGLKRTQAMGEYVTSGASAIMEPVDFYTTILAMPTLEAEAINENAMETTDGDGKLEGRIAPDPVLPVPETITSE